MIRPLSIRGLKVYKQKSPSKFEDKFGNLDLDNIPQEYMKVGQFPKVDKDGKQEFDEDGKAIFVEEEYFDSVQYRQDRLKAGSTMNRPAEIIPGLTMQAEKVTPSAPDMSPSKIGEEFS